MARLAIKGHPTRGNEVIEILKMLGGKNALKHSGNNVKVLYYISPIQEKQILCSDMYNLVDYIVLTLEEFLEKFPYKVEDKVLYKIYEMRSKIKSMLWNKEKEQVFYRLESNKLFVATSDELKPICSIKKKPWKRILRKSD